MALSISSRRGHPATGRLKVSSSPWWKRKKRRKNPGKQSEKLSRASDFYKDFHWGNEPEKIVRKRVSPTPKVLTKLGELVSVAYETVKDGERATWEHEFGETGKKRPSIAADPDSKRLHIVGGEYTVTGRGIED